MRLGRLITLLLLVIIAAFVYWWFQKSSIDANLRAWIPGNAAIVVEIDEPFECWSEIRSSPIWERLMENTEIQDLGALLTELDSTLEQNQSLFKYLAKQPLCWTWQKSQREYEYLLISSMGKIGEQDLVLKMIQRFSKSKLGWESRAYRDIAIHSIRGAEGESYLAKHENLLLISSSSQTIESSIDAFLDGHNGQEFFEMEARSSFLELSFLNPAFNNYAEEVMGETDFFSNRNWESISFLSLDLQLENSIRAEGYGRFNDSLASELGILSGNKKEKADWLNNMHAGTQTAVALHLDNWFESCLEIMESTESTAKQLEILDKIELFLKLDLQDLIFNNLVNDLIFLIGSPKDDKSASTELLIFEIEDEAGLKKGLAKLNTSLSKKSPANLKLISYKDYEIGFIGLKGIFNVVFSDLVEKTDLPYFARTEKYLAFGSTVADVQSFLDSLGTHSLKEKMQALSSESYLLDEEHHISALIEMKSMLRSLESKAKEPIALLKGGKYSLYSFPYFEMLASVSGDQLEFKAQLFFEEDYSYADFLKENFSPPKTRVSRPVSKSLYFENILPKNLHLKKQEEHFSDGSIKFVVGIKDGGRHGMFRSYHKNGELSARGWYRKGERVGVWRFFDEKGKLKGKERY